MKLVDLTRLLDPADIDRLPPERRAGATPLFPLVKHIEPRDEGARVMAQIFGCAPEDLPDGEGWGDEHVRMSTHLGPTSMRRCITARPAKGSPPER